MLLAFQVDTILCTTVEAGFELLMKNYKPAIKNKIKPCVSARKEGTCW